MLFEKDIPADRLIHIMEMARKLSESEWKILVRFIDGQQIKHIALSLKLNTTSVHRKLRKITELIKVAIE